MLSSKTFAKYTTYLKSLKKIQNYKFSKETSKDLIELLKNSEKCTKSLRLLESFKGTTQKTLQNKDEFITRFKKDYIVALQNFINEQNETIKKKYNNNIKTNGFSKVRNTFLFGSAAVASSPAKDSSTQSLEEFLDGKPFVHERTVSATPIETVNTIPSETVNSVPTTTEIIPEPPQLPDLTEVLNQTNALGEPTFASLGLGGWTPVGIIQNSFEFLHVAFDLPWWAVICIGTVVIRSLMFPLVIISQRNNAKMSNNLPQMQAIQMRMSEARMSGNAIEVARYSQELMQFMGKKGINPLKNMIVPLAQAPIFLSFFWSLRDMANLPLQSLQTGGLWWFTDLTVPDQYYLLPIITSATLWATIEVGADTAKMSAQNMVIMKYFLKALPLVILPFTVNFPGAVLCYWLSSNVISLVQVGVLKVPKVRTYFNIEPTIPFKPENLPMKQKGFTESLKESWTNMKITKELEERAKVDEIQFQRAGKGPITKTYKYDPTKAPISAKKR